MLLRQLKKMNNLKLIVCSDKNGIIGINNSLPWTNLADLKHFKTTTLNHYVIMGFNTFKYLPSKLQNRKLIILSSNKNKVIAFNDANFKYEDLIIFSSINECLSFVYKKDDNFFIAGGETIYNLFLPYVKSIIHTVIDIEIKNDLTNIFYKFINTEKENFILSSIKLLDEKTKVFYYDRITYENFDFTLF